MSDQVPSWSIMCTAADLRSACQISKFQNFYNFLNSHQPKGCFLSDRQKKSRILRYKKCKKKSLQLYLKKKSATAPPGPAPPTPKSQKVDFDFCHFFRFSCQAPRCGSKVHKTHRSEVNIKRVMTQNQNVNFKRRLLYACGAAIIRPESGFLKAILQNGFVCFKYLL
jgi:hypothetical protein